MEDMSWAIACHFKNHESNEYVWEITWECHFSINKERGSQINFVDAITWKLLE